MSTAHPLRLRLACQFDTFRQNNHFNDCMLISGSDQAPCHRILLARYSQWFKRYFSEHPIKKFGEVCQVVLPVNPNNILPQFLDLIYKNYQVINIQNLPYLLKMTVFYECKEIAAILKHFYLDATTDQTILYFAEKFIELDLVEDAKALAPKLARHLIGIHRKDPNEIFTIHDIYKSLSPPVFATVLCQELVKEIPDAQKVEYIDNFVLYRGKEITDENDREALAAPVDWTDPAAYQHLVHHVCDWLPPRLARPLLNRILTNRRNLMRTFGKEVKSTTSPKISHWYLYSWAQAVRDALGTRQTPSIDVISFIRTLGGICKPFNIIDYGFVRTFTSVEPITYQFSAKNAFDSNEYAYFMADKVGEKLPMIGFDLGPSTRLILNTVTLDSSVKPRPYRVTTACKPFNPKATIRKLELRTGNNQSECEKASKINIEISRENEGRLKNFTTTNSKGCSCVSFSLGGPTSNGGFMMRVSSLDVNGYFKP
ncbi:BTB/POZ domain containing protein [Tritrichomonas foetus]|uniref:BTB/POZ domain containing protein n=1 Tax=Tritrichomonas foetus TaxID=1144522 RepID=A0A1J4KRP8_9EUKA|nr:BTB/POZ domain containing protein [Tritrichomonas foetus]|eukprot:OHT12492.1 BTB/POZ domain containing protein [Tritrichomonas foetus]